MNPLFRKAIEKPLLVCIAVFVLAAVLVNFFFHAPVFSNPMSEAAFYVKAGQPERAEPLYAQYARQHPYSVKAQHQWLVVHYFATRSNQPRYTDNYNYYDDKVFNFYASLINSDDSAKRDIGWYGEGLARSSLQQYTLALGCFNRVKNRNLKYLNNSTGYALKETGRLNDAEYYFVTEIQHHGNVESATMNLGNLFLKQKKYARFEALLHTPDGKAYLSKNDVAQYYFDTGRYGQYMLVLLGAYGHKVTWWGFLAGFLILLAWIVYLHRLDVFEGARYRTAFFALLLGMLFTFLVYPVTELIHRAGFQINDHAGNDFLYCVFGIGLVEETMKILPLLLLLRFTKDFNEPFDYIKVACLSALGFAFIENIAYFREGAVHIIHGRALTSVVHHMFNSTIVAYGFVLARFRWKKSPWLYFPLFLLLAALSHGFYDFWLLSKSVNRFSGITFWYVLISVNIWNTLMNNALNNSSFFNDQRRPDMDKLRASLLFMLSGVLLLEYVLQGVLYGNNAANKSLITSMYGGTYLLLFIAGKLSQLNFRKGEWQSISIAGGGRTIARDPSVIVGRNTGLWKFTENEAAHYFLPNEGVLEQNLTIFNESEWYLVRLQRPGTLPGFTPDVLLIRTKNPDETLADAMAHHIAVYALREGKNPAEEITKENIHFCGWGIGHLLPEVQRWPFPPPGAPPAAH